MAVEEIGQLTLAASFQGSFSQAPHAFFLGELKLTGNLSYPRVVCVLRWIAGGLVGIPNFDPLYTIG